MRFTKAEAKRWELAVKVAFGDLKWEDAHSFYREWLWMLWCFILDEKRARSIWLLPKEWKLKS